MRLIGPLAQGLTLPWIQAEAAARETKGAALRRCRDQVESRPHVVVMHRLGKDVSVPCNKLAVSNLSIDFACILKRQVDQRDALDTLLQELRGVFSVSGSWHHIYRLWR